MTDQAILVTKAAGCIGIHPVLQLLAEGGPVGGPGNLDSCDDPAPSEARHGLTHVGHMAMFPCVNAIMEGRPIRLLDRGRMRAGFSCIDGVTAVVSKLVDQVPADDPAAANAPSKVYNVGNHRPEEPTHAVGLREQALGRTAIEELPPMQPGNVLETFADVEHLMRDRLCTMPIAHGVRNFVTWYRDSFKV
ncbi:hypothetical protein JQ617_09265 [Bradyrhizobium sp. KB893862 SZCCT0404]|uniref:hypothetical protein n=1 Tax=Bradyrhizobium sp. KB893862 SZCCT0404 TaxID=2807672 RepID=UPI001BA6C4EC|nr:hypothetical protein [Bradyrhizobium sp. KB893862 SZCCT0404]MBR1174142.1 hypothetical protein [Bradyrhizobium sp. KB893862 SZCCT0404]